MEKIDMPALGHKFGDWAVVSEATCLNKGLKQQLCAVCNDLESETIPAKGHSYGEWSHSSDATSYAPKKEIRICARNSQHEEYRYVADEYKFGDLSSEIKPGDNGIWYMFKLEQATKVRLSIMQVGKSGVSSQYSLSLFSETNAFILSANSATLAAKDLTAGTYFIQVTNYGNKETAGQFKADDFNEAVKNAEDYILDAPSREFTITGLGSLLSFELTEETQVQISTVENNGDFKAAVYSLESLEALMGSTPYSVKAAKLPKGKYVVRMYPSFGGIDNKGTVKITNLKTIMKNAAVLTLETPSETVNVDNDGVWFKFTADQDTPLRFIFNEPNNARSLGVRVFTDNNEFKEVFMHSHNGGVTYTATFLKGNYCILLGHIGESTQTHTGSLMLSSLSEELGNAAVLNLGTASENVTIDENGKWFKFSLNNPTAVKVEMSSSVRQTYSIIFKANDLYNSIYPIDGITENVAQLDAGEYFIKFYIDAEGSGEGTIKIIDFSTELNNAGKLTVGVVSETIEVYDNPKYYKITVEKSTFVKFTVTDTSAELEGIMGFLYSEENLSNERTSFSASQSGGAFLDAGKTYYFKVIGGNASTLASGTILVSQN